MTAGALSLSRSSWLVAVDRFARDRLLPLDVKSRHGAHKLVKLELLAGDFFLTDSGCVGGLFCTAFHMVCSSSITTQQIPVVMESRGQRLRVRQEERDSHREQRQVKYRAALDGLALSRTPGPWTRLPRRLRANLVRESRYEGFQL